MKTNRNQTTYVKFKKFIPSCENEHCKEKQPTGYSIICGLNNTSLMIPMRNHCKTVGATTEYNIKRHFESLYKSPLLVLDEDQRKRKLNSSISALELQRNIFKKCDSKNKVASKVSCEISELIAKK